MHPVQIARRPRLRRLARRSPAPPRPRTRPLSALDQAMDGTWEFSLVGSGPGSPPIVHRVHFIDGRFDRSPLSTAAGEFTMKHYQLGGDISFAAAYQGCPRQWHPRLQRHREPGRQPAGGQVQLRVRQRHLPAPCARRRSRTSPSMKLALGGTAALRVRLTLKPEAAVTVHALRKRGDKDLSVAATELTFTTENWNQPQEIALDASGVSHASTAVILITGTCRCPPPPWLVKLVQPH